MKVLLMNVTCKYGSTGKIVYDLYTQLNKDGHKAAVFYGRGPKVEESDIERFSPKWEVHLHALLTRITGYTGCFSYFATKRLFQLINDFNPDVVHLHDMHGYFVNLIPLIEHLKTNNIKTIWTFHCEFMYTGKCGYAYECDKWQEKCGNCPYLSDYPKSMFFDFTEKMLMKKIRAFDGFNMLTIVSPSQWLANRIRKSHLSDKDIRVIYNGVNTEIFHKREAAHLRRKHNIGTKKVVLSVAPNLMSERKGGHFVLKLAERMKKEEIIFILIGIDNLTEKFPENAIAIGRIDNQIELAEYYSMADIFLICSKKENFPTTCIEAISCGTSIVGFDEGGTAETAPGENGVFVEYGDVEALESSIQQILFKESSENNSEKYVNDYSKQKMYEKYKDLYFN